MNYLVAAQTDVGLRKATNQDSLCMKTAEYTNGNIVFCVLCDGMGGLAKGELASATVIHAFDKWFCEELPVLLENGYTISNIKNRWTSIVIEENERLLKYGKENRVSLGTTLTALLIINGSYLVVNVGDSRAYILSDRLHQITEDQTVVQREVQRGNLTPEEAENDPRRNVLLQCIGASKVVVPDFFEGVVKEGYSYMLCSDGFRHKLTKDEIYRELSTATSEHQLSSRLLNMIDTVKRRQEQDNITAAVIKIIGS